MRVSVTSPPAEGFDAHPRGSGRVPANRCCCRMRRADRDRARVAQPTRRNTHPRTRGRAAVFTIAGAHGFPDLARGPNVDPMRVAAQIASGIGFIGAGAIIRDRGSVRGVTTAAALWTSAALGLAAGAGLWWVAAAGAAITLLVLVALRPLSTPFAIPLRTIDVEYEIGHGTMGPLFEAIRTAGAELDDLSISDSNGGSTRTVAVDVRVRDPSDLDDVTSALAALPEVERCAIRRTPDYREAAA